MLTEHAFLMKISITIITAVLLIWAEKESELSLRI